MAKRRRVCGYPVKGRGNAEAGIMGLFKGGKPVLYEDIRRKVLAPPGTLRKVLNRLLRDGILTRPQVGLYERAHAVRR